jgi:hypothetical protein
VSLTRQFLPAQDPGELGTVAQATNKNMKVDIVAKRSALGHADPMELVGAVLLFKLGDPFAEYAVSFGKGWIATKG